MKHLEESRRETEKLLNQYIDYLLKNSDAAHPAWNIEAIKGWKENKWNYIDGCMIRGVLELYRIRGEQRFLDFAEDFVGGFVREDGSIRSYEITEQSLDNVNPAKNLFRLYDLTGREKYRRAIETVRAQLSQQPRTRQGSFWHKAIYPNQVWLDGIYMAMPFYIEYERRFREGEGIPDVCAQILRVEKNMRDRSSGLYYHGFDEERESFWADPESGCSPNFWLRAIGWFLLGIVDVLEELNRTEGFDTEKRELRRLLTDLIASLRHYQDRESGLFYQLVDKAGLRGNYLETSGSALLSAAVLRAVRLGFLPTEDRIFGESIFNGICDRRLRFIDGKPCLTGICLVGGLGGAARRDGSIAYYLSEPIVENDAKGVGPFLLAYMEMLQ